MADSERRYGPTIDLQGFDLRAEMDTVDETSRLPLLVAIALVVLAAFAGVVWLAYTQGVERGRETVSRELIAQSLWKVHKPAEPAYTGLKIYEQPTTPAQTASAPAPTKPMAANAIPPLRPTANAASDSQGLPPPKPATQTTATGASQAPSHAQPNTMSAAPVVAKPQPERVATRAPAELTKPSAAPPAISHPITEPDLLPPASPPKPAVAPSASPAQAPAAAPAQLSKPPAAASTMSGVVLQIGSYKSEAEARQSWNAFKSEHDAASGYQSDVKQVDLGAKGTWYRLRMGPFADKKAALETCAKLKADGASCLVAQ